MPVTSDHDDDDDDRMADVSADLEAVPSDEMTTRTPPLFAISSVPPHMSPTPGSMSAATSGTLLLGTSGGTSPFPPPLPWWHRLLSCLIIGPIMMVIRFWFFDSILPKDSFVVRLRKVTLGGMAIGGFAYLQIMIDFWMDPVSPAQNFVFWTVAFPITVISWAGWGFARVTKKAPDWMFCIVMIVTILCRIPYALTQSSWDDEPTTVTYLLIALGSHLPFAATATSVILTITTLILNTMMFKNLAGLSDMMQPIMFPPRSGTADLITHLLHSRVPFTLQCLVVYFLMRQFNFLVQRAESAVKVSLEIAEKLQKYDTDGVREILQTVTQSKSLDVRLTAGFEGIVENLERYRPHLPNYLLTDATREEEEEEEDVLPPTDTTRTDDGGALQRQSGAGGGGGLQHRLRNNDKEFVGPNREDTRNVLMPLQGDLLRLSESGSVRGSDAGSVASSTTGFLGGANAIGLSSITKMSRTKVAACVVEVHWREALSITAKQCNVLIGLVYDVAQSTQASLHSFIGDQLVATWNATNRTSNAETRSCCFPIRLRSQIESCTLLAKKVDLASMTSSRMASSCFAGDSRLRLFACSSEPLWETISEGLFSTRHLNASAVDRGTMLLTRASIETRGLSLVVTESCPTRIYQILRERPPSASVHPSDQDWLGYVDMLTGGSGSNGGSGATPLTEPHIASSDASFDGKDGLMTAASAPVVDYTATINKAFEIYATGQVAEAVHVLRCSIPADAAILQDACVRSLMDEMERDMTERRRTPPLSGVPEHALPWHQGAPPPPLLPAGEHHDITVSSTTARNGGEGSTLSSRHRGVQRGAWAR